MSFWHNPTSRRRHQSRAARRLDKVQGLRKCRFETMEPRRMLAADLISIGAVYIESDLGSDNQGDRFEINFKGGAPGTELTRVVIDGNQHDVAFDRGDAFFDSAPDGLGADNSFPFSVVDLQTADPNATVNATVADGGTRLELNFQDFLAGDRLVFSIDVDEVEILQNTSDVAKLNEGFDPITSGLEFQGSSFEAHFTANHYHDVQVSSQFVNNYDAQLAPLGLNLSADDAGGQRDRTAGTATQVQQIEKPISLSGTVYHDENLNLVQDGVESGIAGVSVELLQLNATGQYQPTGHVTTTNVDGNYDFGADLGLTPGTYQVREQQPADYFDVGQIPGTVLGGATGDGAVTNQISDIQIPLGDSHGVDFDFAEALPVGVSGHVFVDRNDDGHRDAGEPGIAGVGIELRPVDTLVAVSSLNTTTDPQGYYEFTDLPPGEYTLVETQQPAPFLDGREQPGVVNGSTVGVADTVAETISQVVLPGGSFGTEFNFGEIEPGRLAGRVRITDPLGDCYGVTSEAIPDVTIQLFDAAGNLIAETTTDADGEYSFEGLVAGEYTIVGVGIGAFSGADPITDIVLETGEQETDHDFCEHLPASISGHVFHDADLNGIRGQEDPIANVEIVLLDDTGIVLETTVTDGNGFYEFTGLSLGNYWIDEVQPASWLDGGESIGTVAGQPVGRLSNSGDGFRDISLLYGQDAVNFDFGEVKAGSISGVVHADVDGDCEVDPDEQLLEGVTIELLDRDGVVVGTTQTRADGTYQFSDLLPGIYSVREVQPDGFFDGGMLTGSHGADASQPNLLAGIQVGSGEELVGYNFCETPPASISGTVHADGNGNCQFDVGEKPLAGVTMRLLDSSGNTVATTQTNSQGHFTFDGLGDGPFTVEQDQPQDYFDGGQEIDRTKGDPSGINGIHGIRLQPGENLDGLTFCEVAASRISGFVFQDGAAVTTVDGNPPNNLFVIRDGTQSLDDTPLAGVTLELRDGLQGLPLDGTIALDDTYGSGPIRTVTNADGYYEFTGLPVGSYSVFQVHPSGFADGVDTPGTTLGVAFNSHQVVPLTVQQTLLTPANNDAIVRIQLGAGVHSSLNNFSEVLVNANPLPPIPVPPTSPPVPVVTTPPPALAVSAAIPPVAAAQVAPRLPVIFVNSNESIGAPDFTWHLSIIDGGSPRGSSGRISINPGSIHSVGFMPGHHLLDLGQGSFVTRTPKGETFEITTHSFGLKDGIPVVGDYNGDGVSEFAMFRDGEWFIDLNGNGKWDRSDLWARLGDINDMPAVGDWDADGKDDIAVHGPAWPGDDHAIEAEPGLPDPENRHAGRPKNPPPTAGEATTGGRLMQIPAKKIQRGDLIDHVFRFGSATQLPIAGDWNGDGVSTIGVYRDGTWRLDLDGDGRFTDRDAVFDLGRKGDLPLVGDFDGDGRDDIGVYRSGKWMIDTNHDRELDAHDKVFEFGGATDVPVVGDWDGDGTDDAGLYRKKAS